MLVNVHLCKHRFRVSVLPVEVEMVMEQMHGNLILKSRASKTTEQFTSRRRRITALKMGKAKTLSPCRQNSRDSAAGDERPSLQPDLAISAESRLARTRDRG